MTTPSTASHMNVAGMTAGFESRGFYTGAGAVVPTKVRGKGQTLTRQGVGLYTIAFTDVGGQLVDVEGVTHTAATVTPQVWKMVPGTFSQSAKTVQVECWNVAAAALADPPVASQVALTARFFDNVVD